MSNWSWKKAYIAKQKAKDKLNELYGKYYDESWFSKPAIYRWYRLDENNNIISWYVGKAKNISNRLGQYYEIIMGFNKSDNRHFACSLKSHKDWQFEIVAWPELKDLDNMEAFLITQNIQSYGADKSRNEQLTGLGLSKAKEKSLSVENRARNKTNKAFEKLLSFKKYFISELLTNDTILIKPKFESFKKNKNELKDIAKKELNKLWEVLK